MVGESSKLQPHEGTSGTMGDALRLTENFTLQPHEGTSGTSRIVRQPLQPDSLQPHEGTSGTGAVLAALVALAPLQPHEGTSGTGAVLAALVALAPLQPHEGTSGTATRGGDVVTSQLQPHEGTSGTRERRPPQPVQNCFNPTRVHLELAAREGEPRPCGASTPRGYIWNAHHRDARHLRPRASTPRGYIWNSVSRGRESESFRGFNPTRVHLERECVSVTITRTMLQPHEGTSGTALPGRRWRRWSSFNPTRVHLERSRSSFPDPRFAASTPRGYIWNTVLLELRANAHVASTPRGYIWNSKTDRAQLSWTTLQPHEGTSGTEVSIPAYQQFQTLQPHEGTSGTMPGGDRRRSRRFNPTRVHLEHGTARAQSGPVDASTPRGYIWNHAGFPGCSGARGRTHTSVSVDRQFTSNPREVDGEENN